MSTAYTLTVGMEVHVELKTKTKMFCGCANDPDGSAPNATICPVCMAHPGSLPVINKEAVRQVLRVGKAVGGRLADYTEFDRKNYFYPDLPKGYQISQYEFPLVTGGELAGVQLTRIHLEEDTASSVHDSTLGTLIDYNRGGVPLMELVTEPVIHSAEEAGKFGRELQLLMRYLGASDADMEKGHMRLEANISISRNERLGTKVEVKNINSFRAMEKAIQFEHARQSALLDAGGEVQQETRGWDDGAQKTFSQRQKEGSADYRYFPDPDLPPLMLSDIPEFSDEVLTASLPELPAARSVRYQIAGLSSSDAETLVKDPELGDYFDAVTRATRIQSFKKTAANYVVNDVASMTRDISNRYSILKDKNVISNFSKMVELLEDKKISSRSAKDMLLGLIQGTIIDIPQHAKEQGLLVVEDLELVARTVSTIIQNNAKVVDEIRSGKTSALEFLFGQGMKELRGAVNPQALRDELKRQIG